MDNLNQENTSQVKPLCLELRDSKQELIDAINNIMAKHKLPAFLIRGQLEEILYSVREAEKQEIICAEAQYNESLGSLHTK